MYEKKLRRMRQAIRSGDYKLRHHVYKEMKSDNIEIMLVDIEQAILTGTITEQQLDENTSEYKYLVEGFTTTGELITVVTKFDYNDMLVIITVFSI